MCRITYIIIQLWCYSQLAIIFEKKLCYNKYENSHLLWKKIIHNIYIFIFCYIISKHFNEKIVNCFCDYVVWYNRLDIGYIIDIGRVDKTATQYFCVIYCNVRLFYDDLLDDVFAWEVYAEPNLLFKTRDANFIWYNV